MRVQAVIVALALLTVGVDAHKRKCSRSAVPAEYGTPIEFTPDWFATPTPTAEESPDVQVQEVAEVQSQSPAASPSPTAAAAQLVQSVVSPSPTPPAPVVKTTTTTRTTTTRTTTTTTTTEAQAPAQTYSAGTSSASLPGGFSGINSGVGSWFRASGDQTNGKSWCGYPYTDSTNGFAPDISVMTDGTNAVYGNPSWSTYAERYCGLEAWVYNPNNGKNLTMYIADAFAHEWVLTPGSIDIMINSYGNLAGEYPTDKTNDFINGVQWAFTGRRSDKYKFGGAGDS